MKQNEEKVAMDTQEFKNLFSDVAHECKSKSGLCSLDSTGGDGSIFDLILLTAINVSLPIFSDMDNIDLKDKAIREWKEEVINQFMIFHHNIFVKQQKFNWNYDD